VSGHGIVSGKHDVNIGRGKDSGVSPEEFRHPQRRAEPLQLLLPVAHYAARAYDEYPAVGLARGFLDQSKEGDGLHGLPEPHLIGQQCTETHFEEEVDPCDPWRW